jgi:signal transduction histidine kinase
VRLAPAVNGGIRLEMQDTGSGMAPAEVERAFERFQKGPESRGTGLGLSIARSLIVAHRGEIHASSAPGHGTTMTVMLPRESESAEED